MLAEDSLHTKPAPLCPLLTVEFSEYTLQHAMTALAAVLTFSTVSAAAQCRTE